MSSMSRRYRKGLFVQLANKYFSKFNINMFAYMGATFFPLPFHEFECRIYRQIRSSYVLR